MSTETDRAAKELFHVKPSMKFTAAVTCYNNMMTTTNWEGYGKIAPDDLETTNGKISATASASERKEAGGRTNITMPVLTLDFDLSANVKLGVVGGDATFTTPIFLEVETNYLSISHIKPYSSSWYFWKTDPWTTSKEGDEFFLYHVFTDTKLCPAISYSSVTANKIKAVRVDNSKLKTINPPTPATRPPPAIGPLTAGAAATTSASGLVAAKAARKKAAALSKKLKAAASESPIDKFFDQLQSVTGGSVTHLFPSNFDVRSVDNLFPLRGLLNLGESFQTALKGTAEEFDRLIRQKESLEALQTHFQSIRTVDAGAQRIILNRISRLLDEGGDLAKRLTELDDMIKGANVDIENAVAWSRVFEQTLKIDFNADEIKNAFDGAKLWEDLKLTESILENDFGIIGSDGLQRANDWFNLPSPRTWNLDELSGRTAYCADWNLDELSGRTAYCAEWNRIFPNQRLYPSDLQGSRLTGHLDYVQRLNNFTNLLSSDDGIREAFEQLSDVTVSNIGELPTNINTLNWNRMGNAFNNLLLGDMTMAFVLFSALLTGKEDWSRSEETVDED